MAAGFLRLVFAVTESALVNDVWGLFDSQNEDYIQGYDLILSALQNQRVKAGEKKKE